MGDLRTSRSVGMPLAGDDPLTLALKLAAPYLAVAVFWVGLSNAWLAILAYHAQILFWSRRDPWALSGSAGVRDVLVSLPTALAGPLLYLLLPIMAGADFSAWLASHHLAGVSLLLMIPYFGLIHPFLEQRHWAPLRERTPFSHFAFAGYHMIVLYSLLSLPWLMLCFAVLAGASVFWQQMERRSFGLAIPLSHALADLGIVIAAWLRS